MMRTPLVLLRHYWRSLAALALVIAAIGYEEVETDYRRIGRNEAQEQALRAEYEGKTQIALSMDARRVQLDELTRQFGAYLAQLPDEFDEAGVRADLDRAGSAAGATIDSIEIGDRRRFEFYAELPVTLVAHGSFAQLGSFLADTANLARLVTIDDLRLEADAGGALTMRAELRAYRYLAEDAQ